MNLAMCNCVAMKTKASILIEIGFMTNKREADLMKSEAFCKECAEEAAKGVCKYLGVKYLKEKKDDEMIDKVKILVNGYPVEVERIFKNGTNYVKLRDFDDKLKLCKVGYDEKQKLPTVSK